jgi:hypothetical protein
MQLGAPYKYVSLGCSFTDWPDGYVDYLNENYNLNIINLGQGGGSNYLQHFRLSNLYAKQLIDKDTTLLWQLTAPEREFFNIDDNNQTAYLKYGKFVEKKPEWSYEWYWENTSPAYTQEEWSIFDKPSISINANNKEFYRRIQTQDPEAPLNSIYNLHNTLVNIGLWSNVVKEIILFFGWDWYGENKDEMYPKTVEFLNRYSNISVIPIEKNMMQWSIDKNIPLAEDGQHPSKVGQIDWCKNVLFSYLNLPNS